MSHVSVSKSYRVLVGLEAYASGRHKLAQAKHAIAQLAHKTKHKDTDHDSGRKLTEHDFAMKEEHGGGLHDQAEFREIMKNGSFAMPKVKVPMMERMNGNSASTAKLKSPSPLDGLKDMAALDKAKHDER